MSTTQHVNVPRTLQNLEKEVHQENYEAVNDFIDHQAAEGISDVQQERQIQSFKTLLTKFAPKDFRLRGASEQELKRLLARLNRSDYADASKHKFKGAIKKFYKVENGGREHPDKVDFFKVTRKKATPVTHDDLFTDQELQRLFQGFNSVRGRALAMVLYESAARPGEVLALNISDFTANGKGDFISLQGLKGTPDRTNQLLRSGRPIREWLSQHPHGGELGNIEAPEKPLWVKTEHQSCIHCGSVPRSHGDQCSYEPDHGDRLTYDAFLRRFKDACERADIPDNKARPYNLRHTRLTEVATFMGYEQLNKFAGWAPGSDRAKVYVHLTNDDVNAAIRDEYGLTEQSSEQEQISCSYCDAENDPVHTECRRCGRPLSLEQQSRQEDKLQVLERLAELEEEGVLDQLDTLTTSTGGQETEGAA